MFKYFVISMFLFCSYAKSAEPNLVWERNDLYYTSDIYLTKNNVLLIADNSNKGNLRWVNPETGVTIDSLKVYIDAGDFSLSPDETIITLFGNGKGAFFIDAESKETLFQLKTEKLKMIDNENFFYFNNDGLFKMNFKTNETETIWENTIYDSKFSHLKIVVETGSCIDRLNKFALVELTGTQGRFVKLINIENKQEIFTYYNARYPAFSPVKDEFVVTGSDKLKLYDLHGFEVSKKIIPNTNGGTYARFSGNGNYLTVGGQHIFDLNKTEYVFSLPFGWNSYYFDENKSNWYVSEAKVFRKYDLSSILSINEHENQEIIISPNPSGDNINISANISIANNYYLSISNSLGQNVLNVELGYLNIGEFNNTRNVSNLPSGTYFLRISDGNIIIESSFIKNN